MKRSLLFLLLVFLLVAVLSGSALSIDAEAPQTDPLGIRDWNIHFVDQEILIPTQEFRDIAKLNGSDESDWFRSFDLNEEFVTLSPFNLFTLNFYSEDPDYLADLRNEYEDKYVSITYFDGITSVSYSSSSAFFVDDGPVSHGAGASSFESLTIDRNNIHTGYGVKVTVTVEVYTRWPGGSTVYFEVLDVNNTYEETSASPTGKLDPVTDMKVDQSVGSDTRAYANVSVKTKHGTFSFLQWPSQFSFLWEDGYFRGTTTA